MKRILCFSALAIIAFTTSAKAKDEAKPDEGKGTELASVQINYSCDQASSIKFDQAAYEALEAWEQTLIDAKYRVCKTPPESSDEYVLVVNPVATTDNSKVFFGTIKRVELEKARSLCKTAGQVGGIGLSVSSIAGGATPAAGEIGAAFYKYSGVSCDSLANNAIGNNMLLLLGPTPIVAHAVASKLTKDTINMIPLVSSADKKKIGELVSTAATPPSISVNKNNIDIKTPIIKISVPKPKLKL